MSNTEEKPKRKYTKKDKTVVTQEPEVPVQVVEPALQDIKKERKPRKTKQEQLKEEKNKEKSVQATTQQSTSSISIPKPVLQIFQEQKGQPEDSNIPKPPIPFSENAGPQIQICDGNNNVVTINLNEKFSKYKQRDVPLDLTNKIGFLIIQEFPTRVKDIYETYIIGSKPCGKIWFDEDEVREQYKELMIDWDNDYNNGEVTCSEKPRILKVEVLES